MSEPNQREREIAEAIDNGLIDIEKRGLATEVHTEANSVFLAECLAKYREEVCAPLYAKASEVPGLTAALAEARDTQEILARDPHFVLPAAEKLLRPGGYSGPRVTGMRWHASGVALECEPDEDLDGDSLVEAFDKLKARRAHG